MVNLRGVFSILLVIITMIASSSCSSDTVVRNNPLLAKWWSTPYGIAPLDKVEPQDYMPAFERAFEEQRDIIEKIATDTLELSFESTILAYDNSDVWITDIYNIFSMVEASASSEELAKVSAELMPRLSVQQDSVLFNEALFARIKGFYDIRHTAGLDAEQLRLTEKVYDKFVRAGALLDEGSRARMAQINSEIAELRVNYSQNLLSENNDYVLELTRNQLDGLPHIFRESALRQAQSRGLENRWLVTLHRSSIVPFLTYSENRELRREIYQAYVNRGKRGNKSDNRDIVKRTTELRLEKANLLGYDNYAKFVTSAQMAKSPERAYELLDSVWRSSLKQSLAEIGRMERQFEKDYKNEEMEAWDLWYYAENIRSREYSLKAETIKNYFPVDGVRNGVFMLANRLYGVTFRPIITPQYAEDCSSFEVIDINGKKLGLLHFDLYSRPEKGQGAWCGYLREQRYQNGVRVLPIVSISCNFAKPKESAKSLLSMDEVETLFHESGHALHFLFGDSKYRGLSEVEGDFVELPSQIMERWAFEPEFLRLYALQYVTGDVIPENLIRSITRGSNFGKGFDRVEATAAALLDLDLHMLTDLELFDVDIFETTSLYTKRGLLPQIEPRYHLTYFPHLFTFDYASGYYFYLWAEELERAIFERFKLSGDLFNREFATKFRREILERGGSEDGEVMYRNLMGEPQSVEVEVAADETK